MARCTDAFGQGWSHMSHLLFRPFRFVFWFKMAALHFLMIIMSSNPAGNQFNFNANSPRELEEIFHQMLENIAIIILIGVALILLGILLQFLSATARILFYDGIREGSIYYGNAFRNHFGKIISYFLWNLIVAMITMILFLIIAGIFIGSLFALGVFDGNTPSVPLIILMVTLGIGFFIILFLVMWLYFEMLDSLVLPHMIVKDNGILASWGFAIATVLENLFEFIGYMLLRLFVNIAISVIVFTLAIIFGIMSFVLAFPFATQGSSGLLLPVIIGIIMFIPLMAVYSFIFLPVPTFMSCYAFSFIAAIKDDDDYEPNSGLITKPKPTSPSPDPVEPSPSANDDNLMSTPQEGPVSFRDLEEYHAKPGTSSAEASFNQFSEDHMNREKQGND